MFDHETSIGLLAGEIHDEDNLYQLTGEADSDHGLEHDRHLLPGGLEDLAPGPYLSAIAASVDRTKLNGHDAVRLMKAEARLCSHHDAGKLATMVEVAYSPAGNCDGPVERNVEEVEYAAFEIGSALTLTRRAAEHELDLALSLTGKLRQVWEKLRQGLIDIRRVKVFDRQLGHLSSDTIEAVSKKVLDRAEGLTTGQLQARLTREVMETDPEGADVGYCEGLADRRLTTYANPDGTANQGVYSIAPEQAAAVSRKVNRLARALKRDSEPRTIDQLRADVYVDLLLGRDKSLGADRGVVHLHVDLATLAELSSAPGELAGYGAVVADIARHTAVAQVESQWRYTVTDDDGNIIATGVTRRRPTAEMRRRIEAEHETCVAPGCRMPAYDCDLDHRKAYSKGGPTHNDNMGPLCRYHHMAKHHAPWGLERLSNGDHSWTSPLGHNYTRPRAPPV